MSSALALLASSAFTSLSLASLASVQYRFFLKLLFVCGSINFLKRSPNIDEEKRRIFAVVVDL